MAAFEKMQARLTRNTRQANNALHVTTGYRMLRCRPAGYTELEGRDMEEGSKATLLAKNRLRTSSADINSPHRIPSQSLRRLYGNAMEPTRRPRKPVTPSDSSRMTNETSLNMTQHDCELDNDTAALMARLDIDYDRKCPRDAKKRPPDQTYVNKRSDHKESPATVTPHEAGRKQRIERNEQVMEADISVLEPKKFSFHATNQQSQRSVISRVSAAQSKRNLPSQQSVRSIMSDAHSQAPSIISEKYFEEVDDLPFDDDSFLPLMAMLSPIQCGSSRMHGIQEINASFESEECYLPPVSQIELPGQTTPADISVVAEHQSHKLGQFLKASGQDDQIAAATAAAFEAFLLAQQDAILNLVPEGYEEEDPNNDSFEIQDEDFRSVDDRNSHFVKEEPRHELPSPYNGNVYAKIAAIQMGMSNAHAQARSIGQPPDEGSRMRQHESFMANYHSQTNEHHPKRPHQTKPSGGRERYGKENAPNRGGRIPKHSGSSSRMAGSRYFDESRHIRSTDTLSKVSRRPSHASRKSKQINRCGQLARNASVRSGVSDLCSRGVSDTGSFAPFDERDYGRTRGNKPNVPVQSVQKSEYNNPPPPSMVESTGSLSDHTPSLPSSSRSRKFSERIEALPLEHRSCFNALKSKWEVKNGGKNPFPDEWYLRFAMCSCFNFKDAWAVMKRFDRRYLSLSITSMEKHLLTKTLFPVPGLKSRNGHDMLYMRPSRFVPGKMSTDAIIDNLVYVMGTMLEKDQSCTDGIGVIMNMTDWKMANFSVKYWHKLMATLQCRRVPTHVSLLLIVNPPSWFGSIWTIMRPMLSEPLRSKVHRVSFYEMERFLMVDYERHMPDEIHYGCLNTRLIVTGFLAERKSIEKMQKA